MRHPSVHLLVPASIRTPCDRLNREDREIEAPGNWLRYWSFGNSSITRL
jgi:hypothetical protein